MRVRVLALAALLGAIFAGAQAHVLKPIQPPSAAPEEGVLRVKFVCGTFEGKWGCKRVPGGFEHGKGAATGPIGEPSPAKTAPETNWPGTTDSGAGTAVQTQPEGMTCRDGMVGTPPNCQCPRNSELLGGKCVRYTATTCSNGLAPDSLPQACRRVEEKLSCRMREDGLKDCCCVLYDKM